MVKMGTPVKYILILLFVASIVFAVITKSEQLRFMSSAIAFLMLGLYNTGEYVAEGKRITIFFAVMFYVFCISAVIFAVAA